MIGLPRFDPSSANKVMLFLDFRISPHQIHASPQHHLPFRLNDMVELAQPLDVNMLRSFYVVEELIQLTVGSDAEIIANSYRIEDFK